MDRAQIQADFDRIARLPEAAGGEYDRFLLSRLPSRCGRALELGCGTGAFTRRLAERAAHVVAIDLSPTMIAVARERSRARPNIEYLVADANEWPFPDGALDCAVSIATLHHLPFEETLAKLGRALAPGGVLVVHDLFRDHGLVDRLWSVPAFVIARATRSRPSAEARAAWAAHAAHDRFLTLPEVRRRAERVLPGAVVKRHLRWRYSIVWRKRA